MSLLGQPYATPSRVRGVYRYLLHQGSSGEDKELLESILSPASLIGDGNRDMIRGVINECLKMGLLTENGSRVAINKELPAAARDEATGDWLLPKTIAGLIFSRDHQENRELARAITWYLMQNVYDAPGNWEEVGTALKEQVGGNKFDITNDIRYGQFEDWIVYLGFAWKHDRMIPDPTRYLRCQLPHIFGRAGTRLLIGEVLERLAITAPVLEHGYLRRDVEASTTIGKLPTKDHLSTVTAFAWLRLEDDGYVSLEEQSDARVCILPQGEGTRRVSSITLLREAGGEACAF